MALKLLWNHLFGVKRFRFCHYVCNVFMVTTIHNVNKYVNHLCFIDFNALCYITLRRNMIMKTTVHTRPPDKSV